MIDLKDDDFYNKLATDSGSAIVSGAVAYIKENKLDMRLINHDGILKELTDHARMSMGVENAKAAARRIPRPLASPEIMAAAYFGSLYHHGWEIAKKITTEVK